MSAYFDDEDASAASHDAEGWLRTGDVARIDPDGFLYIVDRTKDVIKSGGEWISSIDLENAAIGHPAIQECAVIAARSEEHTSELQSLMRISYAVFCLKKKKTTQRRSH